LLINSYLPNYEKEQVTFLKEMVEKINRIDCPIGTYIIWGGDFNVIFDIDLEAAGGNASLKLNSIVTLETILLEHDISDIWRVRNLNTRRFTWRGVRQGRNSKSNQYIHRRLDFCFVLDELQPYVEQCDIIPAPSTHHSAITL
jgi:exonuclease III